MLAEWEAVPREPDPVIVARYVPAAVELSVQEAEAVALDVRLVAVDGQVTTSPVVGLVRGLRLTVPAKSNVLVNVTDIEAPVAPELKLTGVPVLTVKSPTWTTELVV